MARSVEVNLQDKAWRSPQRNSGLNLPHAVDFKIDDLLDIAADAGERSSRKEIVAALIAVATTDPDQLVEILRTYRSLSNGAILASEGSTDAQVVELRQAGPGPRKLGGAS